MKTKIWIAVISLFMFASCSDVLDISPDGTQTLDELFQNESTTGGYFSSCYELFPKNAYRYVGIENLPTAISDDAWSIGRNGANSASLYLGACTTSGKNNKLGYMKGIFGNNVSAWKYFYLRIRRINVFLSKIETAVVPSEEERRLWTAEARVLRAFYYADMIGRYGEVYLITEPTYADFDESSLELSSYKTVADFIISECREAMKCDELSWRPEISTNYRRMNKSTAAAIKSRVALFMASPLFCDGQDYWAEAEEVCKESLDELLAHDYELYTQVRSTSVFGDNAYQEYSTSTRDYSSSPIDKESILVTYTQSIWYYQGLPMNNAASAGMAPTQELVDAYPMSDGKYILDLANPYNDEKHLSPNFAEGTSYDENNPYVDRDPRFEATVYHNGSLALNSAGKSTVIETFRTGNSAILGSNTKRTQTGYYPRRHYHPLARRGNSKSSSWRYFRLAEVYLNYAECAIETGKLSDALAAIKPIRDRVNMPNLDEVEGVTIDQDNLRLMYRNERRIEMAYEETRYYDLRRWNEPGEDMDIIRYATGMWIEKSAVDGTLNHMRFQIGDAYDPETESFSGEGLSKDCYEAKYLLHPHDALEVSRLLNSTGVDIQNEGW